MDEIRECIASNIDIFCMGVLLGVVGQRLADWSIRIGNLWIGNNQKKLDLELGKAIRAMHNEISQLRIKRDEQNES